MVNRIFLFIEKQKLTPTEFADRIGVSRASISSIKTGRTQPTLSLVEKIKQHFPDVDINWLIFGEGNPQVEVESVIENKSLVDEEGKGNEGDEGNKGNEESSNSSTPSVANDYEAIYIAESPLKKTETIEGSPVIEKSLKKVILFYSDGSFEEFNK